jgi:hypothetical protein
LLPYHGLGEHKYSDLINIMEFKRFETPSDTRLAELVQIVESFGISGKIGG